ncbi:PREDICTED: uncharacterized protein LOC102004902 [Chinchilla lanigera]|uniref:uncharacterized protein LOC102004902 n=1 Tax=Chinchilla lanigera TaxID=34839 RepID=UPI00038EA1F6|nr:PREDICTED: uncharacterized protein LOC102004902 [Chinchilla lanigera]
MRCGFGSLRNVRGFCKDKQGLPHGAVRTVLLAVPILSASSGNRDAVSPSQGLVPDGLTPKNDASFGERLQSERTRGSFLQRQPELIHSNFAFGLNNFFKNTEVEEWPGKGLHRFLERRLRGGSQAANVSEEQFKQRLLQPVQRFGLLTGRERLHPAHGCLVHSLHRKDTVDIPDASSAAAPWTTSGPNLTRKPQGCFDVHLTLSFRALFFDTACYTELDVAISSVCMKRECSVRTGEAAWISNSKDDETEPTPGPTEKVWHHSDKPAPPDLKGSAGRYPARFEGSPQRTENWRIRGVFPSPAASAQDEICANETQMKGAG